MRRRQVLGVVAVVIAGIGGLVPARATLPVQPPHAFAPGQILVHFKAGTGDAARRAAFAVVGGRVARVIPRIDYTLVRLPAGVSVPTAVAVMKARSDVDVAEPDYIGGIASISSPLDPCVGGCLVGRQWDVGGVNAVAGWSIYPGHYFTAAQKLASTPIKVAVLDTKIDTSVSDWINASAPASSRPQDAAYGGQIDFDDAKDFVPETDQQGSLAYHGTFVAGILAASANNGVAIAGFGYNSQIIPITVVNGAGKANASDVASGIVWAVDKHARVINMSLGLDNDSSAVRSAVAAATSAGSLIAAAAGNQASDQAFYPAWYPGAMAVTATQEDDRPAPCTNHSSHTSVAAPGMGIISLDPGSSSGLRKEVCGTSTATPHVSALAALLFAQNPARTVSQVRQIIEDNADDARVDLGYDSLDFYYGHGRINFERALSAITPGLPIVNQVTTTYPRAQGGTSHAVAIGNALSASPIVAAEYFIDGLGPLGTGGTVSAGDGTFDEKEEVLEADIDAPLTISTGVHRIYLRARNVNGQWGPASVGALVVDRVPPTVKLAPVVSGTKATAPLPMEIIFDLSDDHSSKASVWFKVSRTVAGVTQVLYTSPKIDIALPVTAYHQIWTPGPTDLGPVTITVYATDDANNTGNATTTAVAV